MELPDFTVENLKRLPLRAITAFAARCARRVEHLAQLPEGDSENERCRAAIQAALQFAEECAAGSVKALDPTVIEAIDHVRGKSGESPSSRSAIAAITGAAHAAASAWHFIELRETERHK